NRFPAHAGPDILGRGEYLLAGGQAGTHDFLVVASKDVPVGKGGMGPADTATLIELNRRGFDQFGAANFLKSGRCQASNEQFAAFVEYPHFVVVANHVDGAPAGLGYGLLAFPNAIAGRRVKAAQLAVAIDAVNIVAVDNRRADDAVQSLRVLFVRA